MRVGAGIPQLVLPKGADRPDNASHLKKLRIAEFLPPPKWQPAIIAHAMLRLLRSPEVGANCRTTGRVVDADWLSPSVAATALAILTWVAPLVGREAEMPGCITMTTG